MYSRIHVSAYSVHVLSITRLMSYMYYYCLFLDDVDDSVMYSCQAFYLKIRPNEWHLKFIVVKNIDAFKSVRIILLFPFINFN